MSAVWEVLSSHTSGTDGELYGTSRAAWRAAALDYAASDHGADEELQAQDSTYMLIAAAHLGSGEYTTHDDITFTVTMREVSEW